MWDKNTENVRRPIMTQTFELTIPFMNGRNLSEPFESKKESTN